MKNVISRWKGDPLISKDAIKLLIERESDSLPKLYNKIKDMLEQTYHIVNTDGIIDTFIAKITDELLILFIKHHLEKNASMLTNNVINKMVMPFNDLTRTNKIIQFGKDENFDLQLNEIIDGMIEQYLIKSDQLIFTTNLVEENPKPNDQDNVSQIYETGLISDNNENLCITVDVDIIKELVEHKVIINQKDVSGQTPLYYALSTKSFDIIELLIKYNAFTSSTTNKGGFSPLSLLSHDMKKMYLALKGTNHRIHSLAEPCYNKLRDLLMSKTEYGNNVLKYTDLIMPMLIALLNYNFLTMSDKYINGWSYEKKNDLNNLMSNLNNTQIYDVIPLSQMVTNDKISHNHVLRSKQKRFEQYLSKLQKNKLEYTEQIINLRKDFDQAKINDDIHKQIFCTNEIHKLQDKMGVIDREIFVTDQKNQRLTTNMDNINNNLLTQLQNVTVVKSSNILKELNDFIAIINPRKRYGTEYDLRIYQQLWDDFIKNKTNTNSNIFIHLELSQCIGKLLDNYDNGSITTNELQHNINLINEWYESIVIRYVRDYIELPQELSSGGGVTIGLENFDTVNYAFDETIKIITHTLTYTLFTTFYYTIVKTISKYVSELILSDQFINKSEYSYYMEQYMKKIINNKNNGTSELMQYVIKILPEKVVKYVLKIYEGEVDPDQNIKSLDQLFEQIINIIKTNSTLPVNDDSSIVKNLKAYIFPYFIDYCNHFVKEAKILTDNYYKSMIAESKQIKILTLFINNIN